MIYDQLASAIRARQCICLLCKGLSRVIEPYLIFEDKAGVQILHGWQTSGEWEKTSPPDWINLRLVDVQQVEVLKETYNQPQRLQP